MPTRSFGATRRCSVGENGEGMEVVPAKRTMKVNANGLAIFGRFAGTLAEASRRGEVVPSPDAPAEEIADWLEEQDKLEGIPKEQAALLIELVGMGGKADVSDDDNSWVKPE